MTHVKGIFRPRRFNFGKVPTKTPKRVHLGLDNELPWGQHKNRTVRFVLEHNPSYINWCHESCNAPGHLFHIVFDEEVLAELRRVKQSPDYIEHNAWEFNRERYGFK